MRTSSTVTPPSYDAANNNENDITIEDIGNHEPLPRHDSKHFAFLIKLI